MFDIFKIEDKLVRRLVIYLILVMLIPFILVIGIFILSKTYISTEISNANEYVVKNIKNSLESEMDEITDFTSNIRNYNLINELAAKDEADIEFLLDSQEAIDTMRSYSINTNFSSDYYIYLPKTDYIVTPDSLYNRYVFEELYMPREELMPIDFDDIPLNKFFQVENGDIMYVAPLTENDAEGYVVVEYKSQNIKNILSSLNIKNGFFYILDRDGNVVYSENDTDMSDDTIVNIMDEEDIEYADDYILNYIESKETGLQYYIGIPYDTVFHNLLKYEKIYIILLIIDLIVGIALALFLGKFISRPIQEIAKSFESLSNEGDKNDSLKVINSAMYKLADENKNLQEDISRNRPFVESAYLNRLIKGLIYDKNELKAVSDHFDIEIENKIFYCVDIRIECPMSKLGYDTDAIEVISTCKSILNNYLYEFFEEPDILIHNTYSDGIICILIFDKEDKHSKEDINAILQKIIYTVENFDFQLIIGISNPYSSITNTWTYHGEAKEVIEFLSKKSNRDLDSKIFWYDEIEKDTKIVYFPVELESQLINYVQLGDVEQALELLDIIYVKNIKENTLNESMKKYLISDLKGTILRLITMLNIKNKEDINIKRIGGHITLDENFEVIKIFIENFCALVKNDETIAEDEFISQVKDYICKNYSNADLGLSNISDEFKISEAYFSHKFKENTGINFTKYLETVRVEQAVYLLSNTDKNINNIAEEVGYNSPQSFRRAFKKVMGNNPSYYRK